MLFLEENCIQPFNAGFPVERIHFHGNNKSYEELQLAFDSEIGCIVVDNFYEIELLKKFPK